MKELEEVLQTGSEDKDSAEEENVFEGMRFLAAEDNELNAEILVELLKLKGAEVDAERLAKSEYKKFSKEDLATADGGLF